MVNERYRNGQFQHEDSEQQPGRKRGYVEETVGKNNYGGGKGPVEEDKNEKKKAQRRTYKQERCRKRNVRKMLQHKRSRELVSRTSSQQEMLNTAGSVKTCLVQRDNIEERNCDKLEEKSKKQQSPLISRRSLQFFLRRNIFSAF